MVSEKFEWFGFKAIISFPGIFSVQLHFDVTLDVFPGAGH